MIITEVTRRECCQQQDIRSTAIHSDIGVCKHCLRKHTRHRYTDAAGDTDWKWKPVESVKYPAVHQFGQ